MLKIPCNIKVTNRMKIFNKLFLSYKEVLLKSFSKQWLEEAINGASCKQFDIIKHYSAFFYTMFIYVDKEEALKTDNELLKIYNVEEVTKCYSCSDISLKRLFKLANIVFIKEDYCTGINTLQVQGNHKIGSKICRNNLSEAISVTKIEPQSLLLMDNTKSILIPSNCK